MSAADTDTSGYARQRAQDWERFAANGVPLRDYWAEWEERSSGWKVPIEFVQPVGLDAPSFIEPLRPLLDTLGKMEEVDVVPAGWLHMTTLRLGFLRATDVLWSQVESFYVNAAPRLHRIPPFPVRFGGVSATEDGLYLGLDDGLVFREVRRQIGLGVPKGREVLKEQSALGADADQFIPRIDIAFFTGQGERDRVVEAVQPYLEAQAGERQTDAIKMARLPILPYDHYHEIDVVAEIKLFGDQYRKGYHN